MTQAGIQTKEVALDAATIAALEGAAPGAQTWASVKSAAPAANAVQATTGPLPAGTYDFEIILLASDTVAVGKGLVVEHRNAADGATLQTLGGIAAPDSRQISLKGVTLALNERIRVIAGTAAGAASSMYVSAIGRRLSS